MGLQEQIAEAIVIAFDELGGDPQGAVDAALKQPSVDAWLQQETTMTALAGGAEMLIPGLHALTIPAGISYLIRQMARISWGIGALKGVYVVETAQHSDLRNILTLWANASYFNAHILHHLAIGMDAFEYALTDGGYNVLHTAVEQADIMNPVNKTLVVLNELVVGFGGDERAQNIVRSIAKRDDLEDWVLSAKDKATDDEAVWMKRPMNRRISTKLALSLSTRISARVPARLVMGFIPLAGPIVNAFFNAQTLNSMAESALKYYDNALTAETLQARTETTEE